MLTAGPKLSKYKGDKCTVTVIPILGMKCKGLMKCYYNLLAVISGSYLCTCPHFLHFRGYQNGANEGKSKSLSGFVFHIVIPHIGHTSRYSPIPIKTHSIKPKNDIDLLIARGLNTK
jgi:hypothetical protein